ncbi:hypothetical protein SLEP1_g16140 [Rubroshorea leprosula]|uniref:Uncharacterized protein n=1 Tax=Rubroshorea leprosula TaxID=152421 RepID=A0AAV5IZ48_9ROSI|nr:hypothetical protein SLEP1_g16140 [Rubroshorea leprosula]
MERGYRLIPIILKDHPNSTASHPSQVLSKGSIDTNLMKTSCWWPAST